MPGRAAWRQAPGVHDRGAGSGGLDSSTFAAFALSGFFPLREPFSIIQNFEGKQGRNSVF